MSDDDRYDQPFDVYFAPFDIDQMLEETWVDGAWAVRVQGFTAEDHKVFNEWFWRSHETMAPFRSNCPNPLHVGDEQIPTLIIGVDPRDPLKVYVECMANCGIRIEPWYRICKVHGPEAPWPFAGLSWVIGPPHHEEPKG